MFPQLKAFHSKPLLLVITVFLCCPETVAHAKSPPVSFAGGDGSSFDRAIVVKAQGEKTGVAAEYTYIAKHYPGYRRGAQHLTNRKGRTFDVLEFTTKDGTKRTLYFDITSFFGKF